MNLRERSFNYTYGPQDDRINAFYVPALSCSVRYDRSAGFFSSSALVVAAAGVARLIENNGRMRLLVGAQLIEADTEALMGGADLAKIVANRMNQGLNEKIDAIAKERLSALAWMIQEGTIEVRVVLPTAPDGRPLAAAECRDYFHAKFGIFTDGLGDRVGFVGSINEGEQAWLRNFEMFSVYCSWRERQFTYIDMYQSMFDRLWENKEEGWKGLTIPEAVKQQLLRYCPVAPPVRDPMEPKIAEPEISGPTATSSREAALFQFLRDAPFMQNADRLGEEASAVKLWPHQARVVEKVVSTFPEPYLLCDEVGLGKTLEAGAIMKQLLMSGLVRRCLILTPKSVCRQWQEELYESFLLNVPEFDGSTFHDYFRHEASAVTENPWDAFPVMIASSQLAKRRERALEILSGRSWDLVIVDEAHHARRKDFLTGRYRRNRLLSLLLGQQESGGSRGLSDRTRGLLLLTATPMQVDAREVWDLLSVIGLGGRWGASDDLFLRFFNEIRNGINADWYFLLSLVRDHLENGGSIDPLFERIAREKVGLVDWGIIRGLPFSGKARSEISQLSAVSRQVLLEFIRRTTPLARYLFRNTRDLLHRYEQKGLLGDHRVPTRKPTMVWIPMETDERELYERIEEYISEFYRKYEEKRAGLGFIMTIYRRRLTSSFKAIECSLIRRLAFLRGEPDATPTAGLGDEDFEEDDLSEDATEEIFAAEPSIAQEEIAYVEDFLNELGHLDTDSKAAQLLTDLGRLLERRETVIVFTIYTDTMDWLREKLRAVYGSQVACYSGRGGEIWDGNGWQRVSKEDLKADFAKEKIKILLGTEAMSEGLNLQTCGMMINYDMPWNPMRVEQRIGRIDRIEQHYPDVWIYNYFYEDTVEADVYRALEGRISWFETVVGDLQPILYRVAQTIKNVSMKGQAERPKSFSEAISEIKRQLDEQHIQALRLDEYLGLDESPPASSPQPVTRQDIERALLGLQSTRAYFEPSPEVAGVYFVQMNDQRYAVTFDSQVFSSHPEELHLMTYGEPLFHAFIERVGSAEAAIPPWILRLASQDPPCCAWYLLEGKNALPIASLSNLESAIDRIGLPPQESARQTARKAFEEKMIQQTRKEHDIVSTRVKARSEALKERGRQLLLRAAYLDVALSLQPGGEESAEASLFTEQAVINLMRHRFPFTALIALVTVAGIELSPADAYWEEVKNLKPEALRRKFEELKRRAKELVTELQAVAA